MAEATDIRRTTYRKLMVFGLLDGHRINSIPLETAGWFFYLICGADDFGNLPANPYQLIARVAPKRMQLQAERFLDFVNEIEGHLIALQTTTSATGELSPLIRTYTGDNGELYLHIMGFTATQSAANGKPVRKYPPSPFEGDDRTIGLAIAKHHQADPSPAAGIVSGPSSKPSRTGTGADHPAEPQANADQHPTNPDESKSNQINQVSSISKSTSISRSRSMSKSSPPGAGNLEALHALQANQRRDGDGVAVLDGGGDGLVLAVANQAALERYGVKGSNLARISRMERMTPEIINATYKAIVESGSAKNPVSVLVNRLTKGEWTDGGAA